MNQQQPYQKPELALESRVFVLTIALIVLGVFLLRYAIEVDFLDRRMAKVEAAVDRLNRVHSAP